MKLQNLSVIFIIIIIPILLVVSYYINLQIDTITLQISYKNKLIRAAGEAIEAYEINTVEWNEAYSAVSDSKRRDIKASINTFVNALANALGTGGANRESILPYIPAIVYIQYDGYYVYSPAYNEKINIYDESNCEERSCGQRNR